MFSRTVRLLGATAVVSGTFTAVAVAAGPPPPTSTNGKAVQLVASGLGTPTSFAFGAGQVFEGDAGAQSQKGQSGPGGVFVLSKGTATKLPGSPPVVFGLAWRQGTLYISAGSKLIAWSGWTGRDFKHKRTIYTAPKNFPAFNGLGFGADGRLYTGVDVGETNDHGPAKAPYQYDILSFTAAGKGPKVVATGIRQPWQFVFPAGSSSPFVSDLGQDKGAHNPPDFLLRVRSGQNYGFPACNWTNPKGCKRYAKPFKLFAPHTSVMGLGIIGSRLYMSEFGPQQVVSMPLSGGRVKTLVKGFVAPIVGLGTHAGWVYVGELTGQVFRVHA
ncbi:MAG: hypothetical protein JO168_05210 [Solirubrobacterales bacterium]|nr:hypothetical protein [Solirubrobacterales bacterium]MBV9714850.1 hypothetical protein [Solirubrobacterales bacterium]